MHNPEFDLKNEMPKILWDIEMQDDHLISARRPNIEIFNNKKMRILQIVVFAVPADHRVILKERKRKDKYLDIFEKKTMEYKHDGDTNCSGSSRYSPQNMGKGTGGLGNKTTREDSPIYSVVEIGQNIEKSS